MAVCKFEHHEQVLQQARQFLRRFRETWTKMGLRSSYSDGKMEINVWHRRVKKVKVKLSLCF